MSLRDKILFFGIIIAILLIAIFGFIFPAEEKLKTKNPIIKLKSPTIACSTLENYYKMLRFSEIKDYVSAEEFLNTRKCERLETGTVVTVEDSTLSDALMVKTNDRVDRLYVPSAIAGN